MWAEQSQAHPLWLAHHAAGMPSGLARRGRVGCRCRVGTRIPRLERPNGRWQGAKQTKWIANEYENLSRFDEIVIATDMDEQESWLHEKSSGGWVTGVSGSSSRSRTSTNCCSSRVLNKPSFVQKKAMKMPSGRTRRPCAQSLNFLTTSPITLRTRTAAPEVLDGLE